MAFAVVMLAAFVLVDFVILRVLTKFQAFSSFTRAECVAAPFAVVIFSAMLTGLLGYTVPPWPVLTGTYFLVASFMFFQIEIQGDGTDSWKISIRRSVLSAFVFSFLHFAVQYGFAWWNLH